VPVENVLLRVVRVFSAGWYLHKQMCDIRALNVGLYVFSAYDGTSKCLQLRMVRTLRKRVM
jgi:hypothetical protein